MPKPKNRSIQQDGDELGLAYESGDMQALEHCGIDAGLLREAYWQAIDQAKATLRELAVLRA